MKVSSSMPADLSPSEYTTDPEETKISDEDDDRNHKHRRKETQFESSEKDTVVRPLRKHNKVFQNGQSFRGNESPLETQSWKNYESSARDFSNRFEKRHPASASFCRVPFDLSERARAIPSIVGNLIPVRGRGRDLGAWNHHNPRFNSIDIASQMIQRGSLPPTLFPGRGLPGVPTVQNGSWGAFGMLPGAAGGKVLPSIGLQGAFGFVNMGIPRQGCRDFEERGFCLRGDMCPMEHGVNRIVIEDVQSLSQFNLPVSLPSAPIFGTPPVPGGLASVSSSALLMKNKGSHGKKSRSIGSDSVMNSSYSTSGNVSASELYDPDQPLWSNGRPEGPPVLPLQSRHTDYAELFDHDKMGLQTKEAADAGHQGGGVEFHPASQGTSLSIWGRIGQSKDDKKGEFGHKTSTPALSGKENGDVVVGSARSSHHRNRIAAHESGQKIVGSLYQVQSDIIHTPRRPTQKALRTLFVNGIPQKSNRRDALFAHFKKFGEIIDIHIPSNSERAFVQFSRREEAESALNAPDAVMGNRFIKLWWAKRDNIVDEGMGNLPVTPKSLTGNSVPGNPYSAGGGNEVHSAPLKVGEAAESGYVQASDQSKHIIGNGRKVTPTNKKKLQSLEQLKEELRKKQEMLDRKRDEFKRQLDKLERQTTGPKGEAISEQFTKRQKVGSSGDVAKVSTPTSSDAAVGSVRLSSPSNEVTSSQNEVINGTDNMASVDLPSEKASLVIEGCSPSKEQTQSSSTVVAQSLENDQTIDSCPISFQDLQPLPTDLTDVAALKKNFSAYGDLTFAKLEAADGCVNADEAGTSESLSASSHRLQNTSFSREGF